MRGFIPVTARIGVITVSTVLAASGAAAGIRPAIHHSGIQSEALSAAGIHQARDSCAQAGQDRERPPVRNLRQRPRTRERDDPGPPPREQPLLPEITPEENLPPLHDPQQGDPLQDHPQPAPSQPLDDPDERRRESNGNGVAAASVSVARTTAPLRHSPLA